MNAKKLPDALTGTDMFPRVVFISLKYLCLTYKRPDSSKSMCAMRVHQFCYPSTEKVPHKTGKDARVVFSPFTMERAGRRASLCRAGAWGLLVAAPVWHSPVVFMVSAPWFPPCRQRVRRRCGEVGCPRQRLFLPPPYMLETTWISEKQNRKQAKKPPC